MEKQSDTDRSRAFAKREFVEPARRRGDTLVRIVAGDVHRALGLKNRVPAVCQALRSKKFLVENHLELEKTEGPPSLTSTTVVFTYRLRNAGTVKPELRENGAFLALRGVAKNVFAGLGGGEAFIRRERESFELPRRK